MLHRDLMKWCSRIAHDFVASAPSTANLVYQEALDCFCASLAHSRYRLPLAEAIAARLNLTKATVSCLMLPGFKHVMLVL